MLNRVQTRHGRFFQGSGVHATAISLAATNKHCLSSQKRDEGAMARAREPRKRGRRKSLSNAMFDKMIDEALVDAYGESEQMTAFYTMLEDNILVPFQTEMLGVDVTVERIDMTDDEQIVAVCRRGKARQRIPILELPLPNPPPLGAEWIEAFRRWARGS